MKKLPLIILLLSLAANAALALALHRARVPSSASRVPRAESGVRSPESPPSANADLIAAINSGDVATLLAQFKAAGISDRTAHFVAMGLDFVKTMETFDLDSQYPYWNNTGKSLEARRKLVQALLKGFHNYEALGGNSYDGIIESRYAYLTPERYAALHKLEKDYNDLRDETNLSAYGFTLKNDDDTLKTLAAERQREIAQFLTPEETAARDLRESPTADTIRADYGNIITSETEYKTLYAILQSAGSDSDAQSAARAQIETLLGPDRLAQLAQLNDPDYNLTQLAIARLNLPAAETTASLAAIRADAQQSMTAIASDETLTPAQKTAALKALAAQSQTQMTSVLGDEGAETYAKRSAWVKALNGGSTFTYDTLGKFHSKRASGK